MCTLLLSVFCNLYLKLAIHHHYHKTTPSHHIQPYFIPNCIILSNPSFLYTLCYIIFSTYFTFCVANSAEFILYFFVKNISSLLFVHFNQFVERFELSQFYYCLVDLNTEINCQFCKKEIFSSCS